MKTTPDALNNSKKPTEPDRKDLEAAQEPPKKEPVLRIRITTVPTYKPSRK
jgi:hypothetical protein